MLLETTMIPDPSVNRQFNPIRVDEMAPARGIIASGLRVGGARGGFRTAPPHPVSHWDKYRNPTWPSFVRVSVFVPALSQHRVAAYRSRSLRSDGYKTGKVGEVSRKRSALSGNKPIGI